MPTPISGSTYIFGGIPLRWVDVTTPGVFRDDGYWSTAARSSTVQVYSQLNGHDTASSAIPVGEDAIFVKIILPKQNVQINGLYAQSGPPAYSVGLFATDMLGNPAVSPFTIPDPWILGDPWPDLTSYISLPKAVAPNCYVRCR